MEEGEEDDSEDEEHEKNMRMDLVCTINTLTFTKKRKCLQISKKITTVRMFART